MAERIQKVLARMGLGSRREIERWIEQGLVEVDGVIAKLGQTDEGVSQVVVDGKTVTLKQEVTTQFLQYHKPDDEICSRKDPEGRKTVFDHLPKLSEGRWIAVGRLDLTTSGILLFTTNGEFANTLLHPSAEVDREYMVRVHGHVTPEVIYKLREGVKLDDGVARFTDFLARPSKSANSWVQVVLQEGRNHEVKRMFESEGLEVTRLIRIRFGPIPLDNNLKKGQSRLLTNKEVKALNALVRQAK
ncbi:MAG: pseudouridine synthase [Pseudomonadota bacterium]